MDFLRVSQDEFINLAHVAQIRRRKTKGGKPVLEFIGAFGTIMARIHDQHLVKVAVQNFHWGADRFAEYPDELEQEVKR